MSDSIGTPLATSSLISSTWGVPCASCEILMVWGGQEVKSILLLVVSPSRGIWSDRKIRLLKITIKVFVYLFECLSGKQMSTEFKRSYNFPIVNDLQNREYTSRSWGTRLLTGPWKYLFASKERYISANILRGSEETDRKNEECH